NSLKEYSFSALIISDGDDSIKLITDYLTSHNILVNVINSKQIGDLEKFGSPDIIILDIVLKNLNGWKYLANLKSNPNYKDIPVVVVNMDEEANCGLGLNIYQYCSEELSKQNIHRAIEKIEAKQSIKFRKIMFLTDDDNYENLENKLLTDEIKIYHSNGNANCLDEIKRNEPDMIIVDLYNDKINAIDALTQINDDLFAKSIPVIAFVNSIEEDKNKKLYNNLIETTLLYQYHPLDILKIIKDRIDLYDSSIINNEERFRLPESTDSYKIVKKSHVFDKVKVLIVDDDADARFTIGEVVKSLGYETIFASNGYECLDKLKLELPDLILLDIMMPKMDGFQTIKKIRENKDYSKLNVFALTAYAMLSDKDIIEKNGFNGLFTKPLNTSQIERKLNQIFESTT
ncbi:MAG: response regulator, partial [Melioribacteraceae bacterium]|nr:response regulator [Melioribacteraceae bacterium]